MTDPSAQAYADALATVLAGDQTVLSTTAEELKPLKEAFVTAIANISKARDRYKIQGPASTVRSQMENHLAQLTAFMGTLDYMIENVRQLSVIPGISTPPAA